MRLASDSLHAPERLFARCRVDLRADVMLLAVLGLGGLFDGLLHGFDDDALVDRFFLCDCLGNLQDFQPVG